LTGKPELWQGLKVNQVSVFHANLTRQPELWQGLQVGQVSMFQTNLTDQVEEWQGSKLGQQVWVLGTYGTAITGRTHDPPLIDNVKVA
jgi:hypothetical protein